MATESAVIETRKVPTRRKPRMNKGGKGKKGEKGFAGRGKKRRINKRELEICREKARNYNTDDDDDDDEEEEEELEPEVRNEKEKPIDRKHVLDDNSSGEGGEVEEDGTDVDEKDDSEYEGHEIQPGITKFTEGVRAFKMAFSKITKKSISNDPLGPVLSGHKKLVAQKLAEEDVERKVKREAKKEKEKKREKGHVLPANFLDTHEKFLITVATKGVVKLFNAVSKAQNAQKGLNPSRAKDAKVLGKRRRQAFLSELRKKSSQSTETSSKGGTNDDGPAWAPLRDSYMLSNSKLKNWDKMEDTSVAQDTGAMSTDSSSDED